MMSVASRETKNAVEHNEAARATGKTKSKDTATWDYMAQTSAFHGVGKIWSAPNRSLKVLWLLFLLAMSSAMVYQLIRLTTTFFSFPVKTSVSLAFSPLALPAITFCNSNPVRLSQVHTLNCELQAFLRVEDRYKSTECVNETRALMKDPAELCARFNLLCTVNNTEDVDLYALRKKRTQLEIVKENRKIMRAAGHQVEDLIINCSFGGINCFARNFLKEWTMEYGNCFTMNTTRMEAFDSGPPSGLDIILNLETEDILPSYKTGSGLRVVVHEQNTRPFPSSEGFTLGAGFETHFALRLVSVRPNKDEVTRLGGRYGDCTDDQQYTKLFDGISWKYSTKACRALCLEHSEITRCGCTDAIARVATPTENASICSSPTEFNCTGEVTKEYMATVVNGGTFCPCGNPCQERVYRVRSSSRKWPVKTYLSVLEEEVCSRLFNASPPALAACKAEKAKLNTEDRSSSFVRLRVYFETLNYERILEEPFYDAERFLSDIGGTLGLWIGASLLGLGEALELVCFSLLVLFRYCRRQATVRKAAAAAAAASGQTNGADNNNTASATATTMTTATPMMQIVAEGSRADYLTTDHSLYV